MTPSRPPRLDPSVHSVDVIGFFRRLAAGANLEELMRQSPELTAEDVRVCFAYAADVLASLGPTPAPCKSDEWVISADVESVTLAPSVASDQPTLAPTADAVPQATSRRVALPGYEILGKLGEGGMGVVYKARHLRLNRIVAIKMILAGEHASEDMTARFALEAEAVAQLQHPGIVQIYEIGEHAGHSFLALEYVAGGSLAARLDDKPWPADKAAELVETLARSMQVAHDGGIVHRDLKPENVLLTDVDGTAKITDFGLAKRLRDGSGRTHTGEVMGTPRYMAPEQAAGKKDIGPAADVYALGAILYRLLTGKPPFDADTSLDTMMLVLEQEPTPPRVLNKSVPRDVETIALKCLSKEPVKRYSSSAELADDLRRFLDGEPIKARRLSPQQRLVRWCRKRPGSAIARGSLLLVLFVTVPVFFALRAVEADLIPLIPLFSFLPSLIAVSRTKRKPFLIGLSISLLLAIVLIPFFLIPDTWFRMPESLKRPWNVDSFGFPGFNAENLAFLACVLPLLLGLVVGQSFGPRGRILAYCLTCIFLVADLQWPDPWMVFLISGLAPGFYFGIVCRVVRWYCEGDLLDILVGSIWGTVAGFFVGSLASACFSLGLVRYKPGDPTSGNLSLILLIGTPLLATLAGSILGAYVGAIRQRKTVRGMRS